MDFSGTYYLRGFTNYSNVSRLYFKDVPIKLLLQDILKEHFSLIKILNLSGQYTQVSQMVNLDISD